MKKLRMQVLVAFLALISAAGCASLEKTALPRTTATIDALANRVDAIESGKASNARVAAVENKVVTLAEDQVKTARLLAETATALGDVKKQVDGHGTTITALGGRMDKNFGKKDEWVAETMAALNGLKTGKAEKTAVDDEFKKLGGQVAGARTAAARVAERVGQREDDAEVGDTRQVVRVGPFPLAKYDGDKNEFTACAEVSGIEKGVDWVTKLVRDEGYVVERIVGGADMRKFHGKDGKALASSDELNAACAKFRAQAVAEALGFDKDKVTSRGATDRYGAPYDANRSVRVYLRSVRVYLKKK